MKPDVSFDREIVSISPGQNSKTLRIYIREQPNKKPTSYVLSDAEWIALGDFPPHSTLDEETYFELVRLAERRRTFETALRILAQGDQTETILKSKLIMRHFKKQDIEDALTYVKEHHYIDEARTAENLLRTCLIKGWSRKRSYLCLKEKGVHESDLLTAEEQLAQKEGLTFEQNKKTFIEDLSKKGLSKQDILKKLYQAGF